MSNHPLYNTTGFQRDNKSHVMYALASKQMELVQVQKDYEVKITKIKSDLQAMEQVICLFDGDCSETIKKIGLKANKSSYSTNQPRKTKKNEYFDRGELKALVLKTLRTADTSLKARDVALEIQLFKNIQTTDSIINAEITKIINDSLRHIEKQGLVKRDEHCGELTTHWQIAS